MKVTPLKTPVVNPNDDLFELLKNSLPDLKEKSIVVITSKVVSLCEGNLVKGGDDQKHSLVRSEADQYIEANNSKYQVMLTIKENILAVNAGIDQSNVKDSLVLLPKDPYQSAQEIWQFLRDTYSLSQVGVVITDSTSLPLKWGTVGRALSYCGLEPLKNLIGKPDLFGREMKMTQMNIVEGIAAAAVLEMGEGAERTPFCVLEDVTHAKFVTTPPSPQEIDQLRIELEDDVYAPLLNSPLWKKK